MGSAPKARRLGERSSTTSLDREQPGHHVIGIGSARSSTSREDPDTLHRAPNRPRRKTLFIMMNRVKKDLRSEISHDELLTFARRCDEVRGFDMGVPMSALQLVRNAPADAPSTRSRTSRPTHQIPEETMLQTHPVRGKRFAAAAIVAAGLLVAACGGDDDSDSSAPSRRRRTPPPRLPPGQPMDVRSSDRRRRRRSRRRAVHDRCRRRSSRPRRSRRHPTRRRSRSSSAPTRRVSSWATTSRTRSRRSGGSSRRSTRRRPTSAPPSAGDRHPA